MSFTYLHNNIFFAYIIARRWNDPTKRQQNFKFLKFEGPEMNISTMNVAINMITNNDLIIKGKIMART